MSVRNIGLKDLYVAPITVNNATTYTAGTPVKICNAISAKITEKRSSDDYFDDDAKGGSVAGSANTQVEFEGNKLTLSARALLFGKSLINGELISNDNDDIPEVAFGFRSKNSDGKYDFRWLYVGKFNEGVTDSYQTIEDKAKVQTTGSITGNFYGRSKDGNSQIQINEGELITTNTDASTAIKNWFSAVPEPLVVKAGA